MISEAKKLHQVEAENFFIASAPPLQTDYVVASGIFNVTGVFNYLEWEAHVKEVLNIMHEYSLKGFAFNMLTSYSDADKMRADLYYPDPCMYFDWCKRRYSRNVALLHDYDLYDCTILVRK